MKKNNLAKDPFHFFTRHTLRELTGLKAANLENMIDMLKKVDTGVIYHHTHRFLQQHQYLSPEPPNDFAHWVSEVLEEKDLGEQLESIDTVQFSNIKSLREAIVSTISEYLESNPKTKKKFAKKGDEFHFISSRSFVLPTNDVANNLAEFTKILRKISIHSIYYHIFEAKLRLEKPTNDFSFWIENSLGNKELADKIAHLDPYSYTLEDLRKKIIAIIKERPEAKWENLKNTYL